MDVKGFNALVISGEVEAVIRNVTPLTIGAGKKPLDPTAPDIPLLLDSIGRPVIPGSTLKGFFRGYMERALRGYGVAKVPIILEDLFGRTTGEAWGSHLFFTDAYVEGNYRVMSREHIMINPRTMGVQHGPFEQEYVAEGAVFKSKMHFRNLPLSLLSLIEPVVELTNLGVARLGRSKSRGYGQVELKIGDVRVLFVGDFREDTSSATYRIDLSKGRSGGIGSVNVEVVRSGAKVTVRDDYTPEGVEGGVVDTLHFGLLCNFKWEDVKKALRGVLDALKR